MRLPAGNSLCRPNSLYILSCLSASSILLIGKPASGQDTVLPIRLPLPPNQNLYRFDANRNLFVQPPSPQDPTQQDPPKNKPDAPDKRDDPDQPAQPPSRWDRTLHFLGSFISLGAYAFSDGSARRALGDVKFSSTSGYFVRPKHLRSVDLTGGLQLVSTRDHLLPFMGGNEFSLIGPAGRLSTPRRRNTPQLSLTGGLFAGRVRSERLGFDRTNFTPSMSLSVDYTIKRTVTLYAGYRVSQEIHGVNTNGAYAGFRLF